MILRLSLLSDPSRLSRQMPAADGAIDYRCRLLISIAAGVAAAAGAFFACGRLASIDVTRGRFFALGGLSQGDQ